MKKWINILHFYQPFWQDKNTLDKVVKESYSFLLSLLEEFPTFKITINFAGSLLELLNNQGYYDVIKKFNHFVKNGQIELIGSAMYHPILAKLPEDEIIRQIKLNEKIIKKYFGKNNKINGFFIPELAYRPKVGKIIKKLGYKWVILDSICSKERISYSTRYIDKHSGLDIIFRNRKISKTFAPEFFSSKAKLNKTYVTTSDAELYGHWHHDWQQHSRQVLNNNLIETIHVSEWLETMKKSKQVSLRPGNWESTIKQMKNKDYYFVWDNSKNKIQKNLWILCNLAHKSLKQNKKDPNFNWCRNLMDKAWSSCFWWWASEEKLSAFSPIAWHPDVIIKGLDTMISITRSLQKLDKNTKIKAEKIYADTIYLIWKKHWNKE